MNKKERLVEPFKRLQKSIEKKEKARVERVWIENNPKINILNYTFYKIKKSLHEDSYKWLEVSIILAVGLSGIMIIISLT